MNTAIKGFVWCISHGSDLLKGDKKGGGSGGRARKMHMSEKKKRFWHKIKEA